jgi:hypothetical protein
VVDGGHGQAGNGGAPPPPALPPPLLTCPIAESAPSLSWEDFRRRHPCCDELREAERTSDYKWFSSACRTTSSMQQPLFFMYNVFFILMLAFHLRT